MKQPLLTVIIPTRNRQDTLAVTLRTALALPNDGVEILIHDCSDSDDARRLAEEPGSQGRVTYVFVGRPVSMTENWNLAIARARGELVAIVGDDDAVFPELLKAARWASQHGLDCVGAPHAAYCWPDYPNRSRAGWIILKRCGGEAREFDTENALQEGVAKRRKMLWWLPQIYHGLVRRSCFDTLLERTGQVFDSVMPDHYAAWALSTVCRRSGYVDFPLSLAGYSYNSNSGRAERGGIQAHLREYRDVGLSPLLPDPAHVVNSDILVMDAQIKALSNLGRSELLADVPLDAAYASALVDNPRAMNLIVRRYIEVRRSLGQILSRGEAMRLLLRSAAERLQYRARNAVIASFPAPGLWLRGYYVAWAKDVFEASQKCGAYLAGRHIRPQLG